MAIVTQETLVVDHSQDLVVVLSDLMLVFKNVGGVEHIKSPLLVIYINGKILIKNNRVTIEKISFYSQVPLFLRRSESKPYTSHDLKEGDFNFFFPTTKSIWKGVKILNMGECSYTLSIECWMKLPLINGAY